MKLGDRVRDRYGCPGTVRQLFDDFSAISASCNSLTGAEWLAAQNIPIPEEKLSEMWASVLCDTGGSIWSPVSLLTPL